MKSEYSYKIQDRQLRKLFFKWLTAAIHSPVSPSNLWNLEMAFEGGARAQKRIDDAKLDRMARESERVPKLKRKGAR